MSGYKAYQGQQIEGSGPLGLVLLSYDALYKALGRASLSIQANDLAQEADHTARAMEAIIELSSSLNFEAGEDVATNLASLYQYMMDRLAGNMCSGQSGHINEVMELVKILREGWQQLAKQQAQPQHNHEQQHDVPQQQETTLEAVPAAKKGPHHAYAKSTVASRLSGYAA